MIKFPMPAFPGTTNGTDVIDPELWFQKGALEQQRIVETKLGERVPVAWRWIPKTELDSPEARWVITDYDPTPAFAADADMVVRPLYEE